LPGGRTRTKREPEGGQRAPSPPGGAAQALATPTCGEPPWSTPDDAPSPIKSVPTENPKTIGVFPRTVPQRRHRRRQISGDRSLCSGTLPGRGSTPGAISINAIAYSAVSINFIAISTNLDISYDEEGVVLPRG
jgi:hypothetical protein